MQNKKYPNTLLGYFKNALVSRGESTKYLNRDFLAVFITEYNDSHKNGTANYPKTKQTDFYNKNSCAYCEFLSIFEEYRAGMDRLKKYL